MYLISISFHDLHADQKIQSEVVDVVNEVSRKANLEKLELITSTRIRKHMATVLQLLDMTEAELNWVTDHLRHTHQTSTKNGIAKKRVLWSLQKLQKYSWRKMWEKTITIKMKELCVERSAECF